MTGMSQELKLFRTRASEAQLHSKGLVVRPLRRFARLNQAGERAGEFAGSHLRHRMVEGLGMQSGHQEALTEVAPQVCQCGAPAAAIPKRRSLERSRARPGPAAVPFAMVREACQHLGPYKLVERCHDLFAGGESSSSRAVW